MPVPERLTSDATCLHDIAFCHVQELRNVNEAVKETADMHTSIAEAANFKLNSSLQASGGPLVWYKLAQRVIRASTPIRSSHRAELLLDNSTTDHAVATRRYKL